MGYAIRITTRAVEVVSGADQTPGIVAAESSGVKVGLRGKWGGSELRPRPMGGKLVPQGSGWVMEGGGGSPYSSYNPGSGFPSPVVSLGSTYSPRTLTPEPHDLNVVSNMPSSVLQGAPTLLNLSDGDEFQIAPPPPSRKVVLKKDD